MCGCMGRSLLLWHRVASYQPAEGAFYLPSGIRVPVEMVTKHPTRSMLILLAHIFMRR